MTRRTLLAMACLLALGSGVQAQAQEANPSFFPYTLSSTRLKNGLSVTRVPFKSPGLVAYYTVVRVGSRNEVEPGHTGFAHFFEHVMFKGTPAYPQGAREKLLGGLGFNENAFTADDMTVYHLYGPSSGLETLVSVEADRFRNLQYSEETFKTEAKAVLGEYHKSAAMPELRIEEALGATAFKVHPYRHTTLGFYEDIKAMPEKYQYSREFFKRWYTPDNTMIFVVGDFDDASLLAAVEKHYGPWQGTAAALRIPPEPPQTDQRVAKMEWPQPTLPRHIHAWRTPAASLTTPEAAVQSVLAAYLVGPTSALYKDLVLDQQLAESVSSGFYDHRDPHLFTISATLKNEKNRAAVRKAFDRAVKDIVGGRVDAKRIEDIKQNLRYGLLMSLETPGQVAEQLAWAAGVYGAPDALDKSYQQLAKVTPQLLREFVKRYCTARNRTVLTFTSKAAPKTAQPGAQK